MKCNSTQSADEVLRIEYFVIFYHIRNFHREVPKVQRNPHHQKAIVKQDFPTQCTVFRFKSIEASNPPARISQDSIHKNKTFILERPSKLASK
jgi:hypothetical protein